MLHARFFLRPFELYQRMAQSAGFGPDRGRCKSGPVRADNDTAGLEPACKSAKSQVSPEGFGLLIEFQVVGSLRFLSHAQMLRLFQRACVRAGFDMHYTQGFNPRPRLSLPFPKAVGVESDGELLYIRMRSGRILRSDAVESGQSLDPERLGRRLACELPEGCSIVSARLVPAHLSIQPLGVTYLFRVRPEFIDQQFKARIEAVLQRDRIEVERIDAGKANKAKKVDIRRFIESIRLQGQEMFVDCRVGPGGSVRVDELLELMGLSMESLAEPVRRVELRWTDRR